MSASGARAGRGKQRRSLTHVGGTAAVAGDPAMGALLSHALDVLPAGNAAEGTPETPDDVQRAHVHSFHTYPARMHPVTAARLVAAVSREGGVVFDPFCGSGTVLVEAMLAGRRAVGTDLNPLAVHLAQLKTTRFDGAALDALASGARRVAAFADDRRTRRAGATHRYAPTDVSAFEPHVLLELDSLRAGIREGAPHGDARVLGALRLVLSALLVKLSRRASDTSSAMGARRLAAGYPAKLFVRKADELGRRLAAFAQALPPGSSSARVKQDDATRLRTVGASSVDAIITSPPYVGTYDYVAHHALRMRWLDLDASGFASGEMGSRRRYATLSGDEARADWSRELGLVFASLARVCRPRARVALLIADSAVSDQPLRADAIVPPVATASGFALVARAAQVRPHFHGPTAFAFRDAPRAEHAMVFERR